MDLNIPNIAQRKAAKRSQSTPVDDPLTSLALPKPPLTQEPFSDPVSQSDLRTDAPPQPESLSAGPPRVPSEIILNKENLIALARKMGLELTAPKKIWIKHSYSVTPESKEKFSKYCDVLGIKMQDGLEEALQDWFKKGEVEFKAISHAKNNDV